MNLDKWVNEFCLSPKWKHIRGRLINSTTGLCYEIHETLKINFIIRKSSYYQVNYVRLINSLTHRESCTKSYTKKFN